VTITDDQDDDDIAETVSSQLERLRSAGKLNIQTSRRCRICRDDDLRKLVNTLHGHGLTTRSIMDVIDGANVNAGRSKRDIITYDVVYRHLRNHFDIDTPARAVYREILARRAAEEGKDAEQGVGVAVNALSYLETMMVKGFSDLTDENTRVSYSDGAQAAVKLYDLTHREVGAQEMAEMMRKMNYVITAVMTAVPEEYHQDILAVIDGKEPPRRAMEARAVDDFDPVGADDDDDDDEDDF
jgi:hypothetical protein